MAENKIKYFCPDCDPGKKKGFYKSKCPVCGKSASECIQEKTGNSTFSIADLTRTSVSKQTIDKRNSRNDVQRLSRNRMNVSVNGEVKKSVGQILSNDLISGTLLSDEKLESTTNQVENIQENNPEPVLTEAISPPEQNNHNPAEDKPNEITILPIDKPNTIKVQKPVQLIEHTEEKIRHKSPTKEKGSKKSKTKISLQQSDKGKKKVVVKLKKREKNNDSETEKQIDVGIDFNQDAFYSDPIIFEELEDINIKAIFTKAVLCIAGVVATAIFLINYF